MVWALFEEDPLRPIGGVDFPKQPDNVGKTKMLSGTSKHSFSLESGNRAVSPLSKSPLCNNNNLKKLLFKHFLNFLINI